MYSEDQIKSKVITFFINAENNRNLELGSDCIFVPLDEKIGAKLYVVEKVRDWIYDQQVIAYNKDLGPATYGKFTISISGVSFYLYLTEIAIPCSKDYPINFSDDKFWGEINKLYDKLRNIGIDQRTLGDLYEQNVGYINGKLVCIDFGPAGAFSSNFSDAAIDEFINNLIRVVDSGKIPV